MDPFRNVHIIKESLNCYDTNLQNNNASLDYAICHVMKQSRVMYQAIIIQIDEDYNPYVMCHLIARLIEMSI